MDLKVGESVNLDHGRITITLDHKSGQRARLRIVADGTVQIAHAALVETLPGLTLTHLRRG